jgi:trigger factor
LKTEFIDVSQTRKNLVVEIPSAIVDAEIDRITQDYSRAARIPGFRPGKVPARLVRQRFREQILHDVAHGLIPRAVDDALRERGVEPVDTPDIRDVFVEEGRPLKFTASFETVPPIDPGDYQSLTLRRPEPKVDPAEVDRRIAALRDRAARYEPVEDRGLEQGDTAIVDLVRKPVSGEGEKKGAPPKANRHEDIAVDLGSPANPPGFDDQLAGLTPGETKTFRVTYPAEYAIADLAGTAVEYSVTLKSIKRRVVPDLDDELAKDIGPYESLEQLRAHVEEGVRAAAEHQADRDLRANLLEQLARRVAIPVPEALVEREVDRRLEEFVRRLIEQQVEPTRTNINWEEFRQRQRDPATEAVQGALVLDEVARREGLAATEDEINAEIARYAERSGRTAAAVRASLEKEGGIARLYTGLRREKAIDFLLARATIVPV